MLSAEARLPGVRALIERASYFVIHAPRQVGKTTSCRALAEQLNSEEEYVALVASCETGQAAGTDIEQGIAAVVQDIHESAISQLPEDLRPPKPDPSVTASGRLRTLLARWARNSPRPIVLFLDEIDALFGDVLISVLRQLRAGYAERPANFPHSIVLIGLRDVRDYRLEVRPDTQTLGTASPFNIKVESLTVRNFTGDEVEELYEQHTADTGQEFLPQAKSLAFELTDGQPWLTNALAAQVVDHLATDRTEPITAEMIEAAKEILIQRRDTHLDSLIERLREPRVRRVIEPILAGSSVAPDVLDDDIQFSKDLGLVTAGRTGLTIANPIYREVIPRALTSSMEAWLAIPRPTYVDEHGVLQFEQILSDFRGFWCEHAEAFLQRAPYSEAAAQLVFMAFLHKIVNGGGFIDREYAVGSGRIDLCIRWPRAGKYDRWAIELKVWRADRPDPLDKGMHQLGGFLDRLGLDTGTLAIFDQRPTAADLPGCCTVVETEHEGRQIQVLRL